MTKKLVVSASLLAKSQVAAYTRKDGTMVQAHDNGRQAAAPEPINHKALAKLKTSHHTDARALKSSLASSLSSGDTEGHDGKPLTYGDVKGHLNSMRMQLGSKPEHAEHLKHAQYALNQSFGLNHAPVSEKHAKLIGAALSGKTRMSDDGVVQHTPNERQAAAPKPAAAASRASARQQLEQSRQSKLKEKLSAGGSIEDGEAKAAGFKSASHATAKLGGSAAPAKMKNVGTDKWPLHAKSSDALGAKHPDGSTHHVGGFEPPVNGKGDHLIHHDGKTFSYSGKSGKNMKTGEASYEYRAGDSGEHRAWVTHSGHLMND